MFPPSHGQTSGCCRRASQSLQTDGPQPSSIAGALRFAHTQMESPNTIACLPPWPPSIWNHKDLVANVRRRCQPCSHPASGAHAGTGVRQRPRAPALCLGVGVRESIQLEGRCVKALCSNILVLLGASARWYWHFTCAGEGAAASSHIHAVCAFCLPFALHGTCDTHMWLLCIARNWI